MYIEKIRPTNARPQPYLILESYETIEDVISKIKVDNDYHYDNIEFNDDITYDNLECFDELQKQYEQEGLIAYYYGTFWPRQGVLTIKPDSKYLPDYKIYFRLYQPFEYYKYKKEKLSFIEYWEQDEYCNVSIDFNHETLDGVIYRKPESQSKKFDYGYGDITSQFCEALMTSRKFSYKKVDKQWLLRQFKGDYTTNNILPYLENNFGYNNKSIEVKYLTPETIKR